MGPGEERGAGDQPVTRRAVLGSVAGTMTAAALTVLPAPDTARARPRRPAGAERLEAMAIANDPLPSWNVGANKQAILDFVTAVTEEGGDQFVPENDRIATFDNDGTLWVEQPIYAQGVFAFDEIKRMAANHPEWQSEQPFAAILADDQEAMAKFTEHDIAAIVAQTHAGMTTTQFDEAAKAWLATAKHPRFDQLYTDCVYQPQLELLEYLRANGFQTFIASGGGIDFLRTFAEETYGIPPAQVIGSSGQVTFSLVDGVPTLTKEAKIGSIDDKDGKPINIHLHIGQKPILAFGNSDGDQAMLQYTDSGDEPRLMLLVHHDDAEREYAYDRDSSIGKLDSAWDEAVGKGWIVVSMKDDWGRMFSFAE
jgi:phosphoglycolate phosphatase-like HAD superfamily hydrolase